MNPVMVNNPFGNSEVIGIKCGRAREISAKCFFHQHSAARTTTNNKKQDDVDCQMYSFQ